MIVALPAYVLECDGCGTKVKGTQWNVAAAVQWAAQEGWLLVDEIEEHLCPACSASRREERRVKRRDLREAVATATSKALADWRDNPQDARSSALAVADATLAVVGQEAMSIDVILGVDREVVGVHLDGHGANFVLEEPYVHSLPIDSGWTVRRYTVEVPLTTWPDDEPMDQVGS